MTSFYFRIILYLIQLHRIFSLNVDLIFNYFNSQNVQEITACVCTRKDAMDITRYSGEQEYRIMSYSPETNDEYKFNSRPYPQGVFIDLTCSYNIRILESDHGAMNTSYKWFAWIGSEDISCLDRSLLGVDSDMVVATESGELYDVYKIGLVHPVRAARIGNWSRSGGISLRPRPPRDLAGATLRESVTVYVLKVNKTNYRDLMLNKMYKPNADVFIRYHFAVAEDIRYFYKYNTVPVFTNATAYRLPDGRFGGMVGDLFENRSDIGLHPAQAMKARAEVVKFLHGLTIARVIFVFLNPKALGTYKALLQPLSLEVWLAMLGTVFMSASCYYFIQKYSPSLNNGEAELSGGFIYIIGVLAQQGLVNGPSTSSLRVLGSILLVSSFVISTYYNASVMNGLLSSAPITIRSVKQLVDSPFGLGNDDVPYMTIKENTDVYFTKDTLAKIHKTKNSIVDVRTGLERVRKEQFAFAGEDSTLKIKIEKLFNEHEKCALVVLEVIKFPFSMSIQRNSSFNELFTRGILRVKENGIANRLLNHWYPKPINCPRRTRFAHVSMEAVSTALSVFIFGVISSWLILVLEITLHRNRKNNKIKKSN